MAKIDIMSSLQKMFKVSLPIILDDEANLLDESNQEMILDLPNQVIELLVTNGELQITNMEER